MAERNRVKRVAALQPHAEAWLIGQKTITTTATLIVSENNTRHTVSITNHSTVPIFLYWENTGTIDNGYRLGPLESIEISGFDWDIWGIVETGTAKISFWELADIE